jgi:hypothetical protein
MNRFAIVSYEGLGYSRRDTSLVQNCRRCPTQTVKTGNECGRINRRRTSKMPSKSALFH